jgi:DNA-binding transcriptional LysR family regulator
MLASVSTCAIPAGLDDRTRALETGGRDARRDRRQANDQTRWRTIEVRHLAALAAVAEQGSFHRAADRLGYVQSAISSQIAHLERAAGIRLVERASGSSSVRLTAAGRVLLGHTIEIIARLEAAHADVSSLAARAAGTVRVAGLERFSPRHFARILRCFRERYPLARVILDDAATREVNFQRLRDGAIDLLISELPAVDGPFSPLVVEQDRYVLLVAADSALAAGGKAPTVAELAPLRLLIPGEDALSDAADARLKELGIGLRSPFRVQSVATAQAIVTAGLGEAIVPHSQIDRKHPGSVAIELPGLLPERAIALVYHSERERPTAVHGFMRAVSVAFEAERQSARAAAA